MTDDQLHHASGHDQAYDSAELRRWLKGRGTKAVVPNRSNRKQPFSFDRRSYKQRQRIENAFCRLKDFRRIATRYDRLARNFLASVCLVAAIVWWMLWVSTLVTRSRRLRQFSAALHHGL
jgi:transposase